MSKFNPKNENENENKNEIEKRGKCDTNEKNKNKTTNLTFIQITSLKENHKNQSKRNEKKSALM